jgi:thioredoxin reductase
VQETWRKVALLRLTLKSEATVDVDYLVIGAGPAGLQLGYFLEQTQRDHVILEASTSPGAFFQTFPRHRKLISINKVYTGYEDPEINLRWDWNSLLCDDQRLSLRDYSERYFPSAEDLVRYLADFANAYKLRIEYGARVERVTRDGAFKVRCTDGRTYSGRKLIVATGLSTSYVPAIPGIELAEQYANVSVDPREFANQRVLIIGKANSAFETADNLIEHAALIHLASPRPIRMAWQSHFVGHLRAINNNLLDTYQLKLQNAVLDATIDLIERVDGRFHVHLNYSHAHGEKETLIYDRVIACTGFRFDDSIFDDTCRPALAINDRFPRQTSEWESANVPGMYFAGTLTQMRDYRKTSSGFIHGFRYNVRALHRMLESKYHEQPWPRASAPLSPEALTHLVIQRINRTSALWQQFGFLCDVLVVNAERRQAEYFEEMPVAFVSESAYGQHDHYYQVTLEYGPEHDDRDPFNVTRVERSDTDNARDSHFLHPVVRRYSHGTLLEEHHVIEDLAAEWREDVHVTPLLAFFRNQLAGANRPANTADGRAARSVVQPAR